ncbi:hypothetical protein [Bacillus cereus group sp. N21]|nr:hypothetical protein [Bacillus cereus group sp. N21]
MTHQKVLASERRGFIEMNSKNIKKDARTG